MSTPRYTNEQVAFFVKWLPPQWVADELKYWMQNDHNYREETVKHRIALCKFWLDHNANARLMEDALKECLNALEDYVPTLERQGATMGYGNAVIAQARAAIAKAQP